MSNSLNKVQLIGNLTAEPEVRETPNGQKVATFSVATNRKWKDASGMLQEEVEYHNCVAWRGLADIAEQYMHKGKKVYIEGYLKTRSWDDTAGVKRYKTEIVSDNVILLGAPGAAVALGRLFLAFLVFLVFLNQFPWPIVEPLGTDLMGKAFWEIHCMESAGKERIVSTVDSMKLPAFFAKLLYCFNVFLLILDIPCPVLSANFVV